NGDERVNGNAFRLGIEVGEFHEKADTVFAGFAHAKDAAAADIDAGLADIADGLEAVFVGAGGDDFAVVLGAGVEVVVVGFQSGLFQAVGLVGRQHAEGHAAFHAEAVH